MIRTKRGLSHLEFILSLIVFLSFLTILMIVINPLKVSKKDNSLEFTEEAIRGMIESNLTYSSFYSGNSVDKACFTITKNLPGKVVVKDKGDTRIQAGSSGEIITIYEKGRKFYKIFLLDNFIENPGENTDCSALVTGTYGVPVTYKIISYEKMNSLKQKYDADYIGLKGDLKITNDFILKISLPGQGQEILMERQIPSGVSTRATDEPIEVINSAGNIFQGKMNLIVW